MIGRGRLDVEKASTVAESGSEGGETTMMPRASSCLTTWETGP